ncbi:MAG: recombinase family protein [Solirubrobacterales bacterium]|nr:recombinase family protein [Solirubrobacterales bacterium]
MSDLIGYARVSTEEQTLDLQIDALTEAGCSKIYTDKISGSRSDRPELVKALDYVRAGDTLAVWRLDRLGRSVRHLIEVVNDFEERGIGFKSLQETIDTTTSTGKLTFHVFAALAQFERDLIAERTKAGLEAARRRGRVGGRRTVMSPDKLRVIRDLYEDPKSKMTVQEIADTVGVSRATVYRHLEPASLITKG